MAPAKPPRWRGSLIIQPARSRTRPRRGILMPVSWGLTARYKRIGVFASTRGVYAWAGRAGHTARFSVRVRCVRMLIMLMGRRLSLSVMRGLNRETALRVPFVFFSYSSVHLHLLSSSFPRGTPSGAVPKGPIRVLETPSGQY